MSGRFAPQPGAAPLSRQVLAQAGMETRLLLRNGEQLLLAVVIPVIVLVGAVAGGPVGAVVGVLAQEVMRKPIDDVVSTRYRVRGTWDKPDITLIGKSSPRQRAAEGGSG